MITVTDLNFQEMIERIASGSSDAFELLVDQYTQRLMSYCTPKVRDEAADVLQEVFIKLVKTPERIANFENQPENNFLKFVFTIARNECANILRKRKMASAAEIEGQIPAREQSLEPAQERERALNECIESHGGRFKEVLKLGLVGMNSQEIADQLRIAVGSVYKYKHDGQDAIRTCLEGKLK